MSLNRLFKKFFYLGYDNAEHDKTGVFSEITEDLNTLFRLQPADWFTDEAVLEMYAQTLGYVVKSFELYPDAMLSQDPGFRFIKFLDAGVDVYSKKYIREGLYRLYHESSSLTKKSLFRLEKIFVLTT